MDEIERGRLDVFVLSLSVVSVVNDELNGGQILYVILWMYMHACVVGGSWLGNRQHMLLPRTRLRLVTHGDESSME